MIRRFFISITLIISFVVIITNGSTIFSAPVVAEESLPEETAVEIKYVSPYIKISPFDHHFRAAGDSVGLDWKFIAAIAFTESRFDSMAHSSVGACGVMQVMPRTLRQQGVPDSLYFSPEHNIKAAAGLIDNLNHIFRRIDNFEERSNFILASYNAGIGEISDAMRLAEKYGRNRYKWENSVDTFLILKSNPEYYNDELCKNGSFYDWKQTLQFVRKVKRTWNRYIKIQEQYNDSIFEILQSDSTVRIKR
jgi:membrane-bound lytic murein transglycosylase F